MMKNKSTKVSVSRPPLFHPPTMSPQQMFYMVRIQCQLSPIVTLTNNNDYCFGRWPPVEHELINSNEFYKWHFTESDKRSMPNRELNNFDCVLCSQPRISLFRSVFHSYCAFASMKIAIRNPMPSDWKISRADKIV